MTNDANADRTEDDSANERRYGLEELVELAFEAAGDGQAHERYQVLRRLLGVNTDMLLSGGGPDAPRFRKRQDERGRRLPSSIGAPGLAHNIVLAAKDGKSPFSGYLEAPPDVIALYADHKDELEAAIGAGFGEWLAALRRLGAAAIRSAEPEAADRTVTLHELRAAAWDSPPSPSGGDDDEALPEAPSPRDRPER